MFKKILIALIVSMLMPVTASAGIVEMKAAYKVKDYALCSSEAAKVIADSKATVSDKAKAQLYIGYCYYRQKDYAKAIPEFQKAISNYPEVVKQCAVAQRYIGHCYYRQKDYAKAIPEFQKVISDYPTELANCAKAQRYIGYCYYDQKDFAKALPEFQKVISDYPERKMQCAKAQDYIGLCYVKEGKIVEAQASYMQLCKMQGAPLGRVISAFNKIDKVALGKVEYLKLIDTMLLVIPATAANAEFLGVLKSEQEKLK